MNAKRYYEIREGDGNQGTFYRATIQAKDMDHAIRIARRSHMSLSPYWRRQLQEEGDDKQCSLCVYPTERNSAYGACPYVMDINEISKEDADHNATGRYYNTTHKRKENAMNASLYPRIYVASLSDYNNGNLHGVWIELDGKEESEVHDEINVMLKASKYPNVMRIECECKECGHTWVWGAERKPDACGICDAERITCSEPYTSAEEYAIHDFEGFYTYRVEEYASIATLIKIADAINEYDDNAEAFLVFLSDRGDLDDAIEHFEEAFQGEYDSELEFTYQLVDNLGMLDEVPEHLRHYFDYESFARDLFINDYSSEKLGNYCVAVFNRNV